MNPSDAVQKPGLDREYWPRTIRRRAVRRLPSSVRTIAWVIAALVCAPLCCAQDFRVAGIVRDSSGAGVAAAQVVLRAGAYSGTTRTDGEGNFSFASVPADSGTIEVTAKGFSATQTPWKLVPGQPLNLEIVLSPASVSQRVVVTSARTPTPLSDSPASFTQLTRSDLQATPALTLDDQLRQVPGFSIFRRSSSRTANPTTQGVSLRGLGASGSSRALVLQDGIPLNDPFGGWIYWDRIPSESIAGVEIDQEGASSLYGSDALGGVVQFLSKPASSGGISLETSYGNQNSPEVSLSAGGQLGKWESTFAGQVFHTDGYILVPQADRGSVDTKAGVSDGTANLMIGRKISAQSEIFARGWYFDESRNNGTPVQTNSTRLGEGALGANLQLGEAGTLALRFFGEGETYHQNFSSIATGRNSENLTDRQTVPAQEVGGSALWSRSAGKHQTLVAGFDAHENIGTSHDDSFSAGLATKDTLTGGHQRDLGVFGEDLIQLAPKWLLTVSVRFDDWRNFDASSLLIPIAPPGPPVNTPFANRSENAFSPRASLVHEINSHVSWSASMYRAFRAPTLNELYRPFRQGIVLTEANSALDAERLTGGNAGVEANGWNHRVEFRGIFFFNEIIDPIANVTLSQTSSLITRQRQNMGRTTAPGFEFDATTHITSSFQISGGYQYVAANVNSFPANPALVGLRVAQVPRNTLTFQARYTNPSRINFTVSGRMVGLQYDDDKNQSPLGRFFVLGAMASRGISHGVEIFAAAENLLNAEYATAATPVPQLGLPITARFGLRFQFPWR